MYGHECGQFATSYNAPCKVNSPAYHMLSAELNELALIIEATQRQVRCAILVAEPDGRHLRCGGGPSLPEFYYAALDGLRITPPYFGACGEAMHLCKPIIVPNIAEDDRWPDSWKTMVLSCGFAALWSSPIITDSGQMVGALALYFDEPCNPIPTSAQIIEAATRLAAMSIVKSRTIQEQYESQLRYTAELADMQVLQRISGRLFTEVNPEDLFSEIVSAAVELTRANKGVLQLYNSMNCTLSIASAKGFDPTFLQGFGSVTREMQTSCAASLRLRERVVIYDYENHPAFTDNKSIEAHTSAGVRAGQSTPLVSRSGVLVGMLSTHWEKPLTATQQNFDFLDILARQAADLIERAEQEHCLRESEERFRLATSALAGLVYEWDIVSGVVQRSEGLIHITGHQPDEVPNNLEWWRSLIHPDDLAALFSEASTFATHEDNKSYEYRIRHRDGEFRWISDHSRIVSTADGIPRRRIGCILSVNDAKIALNELEKSQERLRLATDAAALGVFEWDVGQDKAFYQNDRMYELMGLTADQQPYSLHEFKLNVIHPDDIRGLDTALSEAMIRGSLFKARYRVHNENAGWRWLETFGKSATITGAKAQSVVGVVADITARQEWETRQRTVINELAHRTRNTLALVMAIAQQTQRNSTSIADYGERFRARLMGLGVAHEFLTNPEASHSSLNELAARTLKPLDPDGQVAILGLPMDIADSVTVSMTMALHELAANASKYGALSRNEGRVWLTWALENNTAVIEWREEGGPEVKLPRRTGFGTQLITQILPLEFHGSVDLDYAADGVKCIMRFPLSNKIWTRKI